MNLQLITTGDGSHSIYRPDLDEQYHSVFGAVQESMHVYIKCGFDVASGSNVQVFEMGFGTGLNAILTFSRSSQMGRHVKYYSIEKYPLEEDFFSQLNYGKILMGLNTAIFEKMHLCEWDRPVNLGHFDLHKIKADILTFDIPQGNDLVYYDAFSPDKEPGLWSQQLFARIYESMNKGGVLVTYSAKGDVRRALMASGFRVEKLNGPPGKLHMLRGVK